MAVQNPPLAIQTGGESAELFRRYTAALVPPGGGGVLDAGDLKVAENGTPNLSVNVAAGRILIPGTESSFQGTYFAENRSTLNVAIAAADATNPRKDLVVAKVQDAAYSGVTNAWSLVVVTGTPAPSPAEPAVPANAMVLALVDVPANDTAITNSQITDRRTLHPIVARGRGEVDQVATTSDVVLSTTVGTFTTLVTKSIPVINGRRYRLTFEGLNLLTSVGPYATVDQFAFEITAGGTVKGGYKYQTRIAAASRCNVPTLTAWYDATSTGNITFLARATKATGDAALVGTVQADATHPLTLSVEDVKGFLV